MLLMRRFWEPIQLVEIEYIQVLFLDNPAIL